MTILCIFSNNKMICSETLIHTGHFIIVSSVRWSQGSALQGLRWHNAKAVALCYKWWVTLTFLQSRCTKQSSNGAQPLIFNVQLWVFTYRRGSPRFVPRWWSSVPQVIILRMEAPGRGKGNWGTRICFMWFDTAGVEIKVWNYTKNHKEWFYCTDISSLIDLAPYGDGDWLDIMFCAWPKPFNLLDSGPHLSQGDTGCCCRILVAKNLMFSLPSPFSI